MKVNIFLSMSLEALYINIDKKKPIKGIESFFLYQNLILSA